MSASIKMAKARTRGYGPAMGDPGIFGFIGKAIKGAVGIATGVVKSLPGIGPVATGLTGLAGRLLGRGATAPAPAPAVPWQGQYPAVLQPAQAFSPGANLQLRTISSMVPQVPRRQIGTGMGTMPTAAGPGLTTPPPDASGSWRANKTGYYVAAVDGQPEQGGIWIAPQSVWVRKRRRNSLNPRALDRALSRVGSAKKATKKLGRVTIRSACPNH